MSEHKRRVVCSANMDRMTGATILGARHFDITMRAQLRVYRDAGHKGDFSYEGFIDQHGVFMDRQEAWKVAQEAGQIIRRVGGDDANGGTLYSENIC